MAKQTVSRTALGAAICRLIEQYQPPESRLFNDPVAKDLVGAPLRAMLQFASLRNLVVQQTDAVAQGIFGAQICRTRYIDEVVQATLAQGIGQVVILGARLDTRPYRLAGMGSIQVFEVDLPAIQNDKKKNLTKRFGQLPGNVTFLPIDFDTQRLAAVLAGAVFDAARPTLFVWEGVTQYVSEDTVRQTFAFVGKTAPGSRIVFTHVLKSVIEQRSSIPGANHLMAVLAETAPWIFGLEPASLAAFLNPFRLALTADVGQADYQENYLQPLGRKLTVFAGERIAQASVY